jgi:hypothetical protein
LIFNFQLQRTAAAIAAAVLAFAGCERRATPKEEFLLGVAAPWSAETVAAARVAQADTLRGDVTWSGVETSPGKFALSEEMRAVLKKASGEGIAPLGILAYGNRFYDAGLYPTSPAARAAYATFAGFAVGELRDDVSLWEVWNEWNLAIGMPAGTVPGSPEDYVALLRETYERLKPAFPSKIFLGGSVAGIGRKDDWTRRACEAGLLRHLDGFSFHPYVYWMSPERRVPERGLLDLVGELEGLLAKYPGGAAVPLYVTELGWPTHDGTEGVTLDQQAKYLSRAILLLRADPRIRGLWIYTLRDGDGLFTDRESHFGLQFVDGSPKPAWFAFRDTAALVRTMQSCRRIVFEGYEDDLAGVEFVDVAGRRSLAIWAIDEGAVLQVDLRLTARPWQSAIRTRIPGLGAGPRLPIRRDSKDGSRQLSVTVSDRPLVLEDVGALQEVEWVDTVRPAD